MKFPRILLVAIPLLSSCADRGSDDQQVRDVIAKMEAAAEARDTSDVLDHVAASYADASGNDKPRLQDFLRGYFLVNPTIEVIVDIESLEFPVAGLAQGRIDLTVLPAGDRASFAVELRRQDDAWQVVRADRVRGR